MIVIVLEPELPPCVMVTLFADRLKSGVGAALTIRVTGVLWVVDVLVPMIVVG